jgi:hypothetical protein
LFPLSKKFQNNKNCSLGSIVSRFAEILPYLIYFYTGCKTVKRRCSYPWHPEGLIIIALDKEAKSDLAGMQSLLEVADGQILVSVIAISIRIFA